jgi:outer membrane protein assembly factor BamC
MECAEVVKSVPLIHPKRQTAPRSRPLVLLSILAGATLLVMSGCSSTAQLWGDDKIDYRSQARKTNTLEVPPDLTQLAREGRFGASPAGGEVRASALASGAAPVAVTGGAVTVAPVTVQGMRVERRGNQRWLVVPQAPESLWPQLKSFWSALGFTLEVESPQTGVMETAWAENRAKLPQDFIRGTIGRLFENLYSTSERDRFRTRLERGDGSTEIFISHRGLQEVYTSTSQDRTVWQPRPSDPELEAEFLTRLMVQLGAPEATARQTVAQAVQPTPSARTLTRADGPVLEVDDSFDRAWRRVGLALDRSGFTVEDRDRAAGQFDVRYIDPAETGREEPGLLSRLFGAKKATDQVQRFRVQLKAEGTRTVVSLRATNSTPVRAEDAQRILNLLAADLR